MNTQPDPTVRRPGPVHAACVLVLVVVALVATLAACGVPHDDHVHRVGPHRVPKGLLAPATPGTPAPTGAAGSQGHR